MSEKKFSVGRFVWHDLMAKDPDAARAFYTELMGWNVREMDMGEHGKYTMLLNGENGLGGIVSLAGAPDIPSHWIDYITVEDVDASCKKVDELGGKTCVPAFDIPGVGRTAVVEDPNGAVFHLFRSAQGDAPERRPAVGDFCWYDCLSDDMRKAESFYGGLFGWTFVEPPFQGGPKMSVASRGDVALASIMEKPAGVPRSVWMNYLLVDELDESTARAERLGAKKLMGPTDIPTIGRFNLIEDPAGAQVILFENAPA